MEERTSEKNGRENWWEKKLGPAYLKGRTWLCFFGRT